ncbi:F-box-like/WD repeat-containing protein ebi [Aphelenchoides besseyi]|nr:F-box-like/WD repeat-containing protein ebi [Aphelenchoides besseyi]KAI6209477.1 F-box-like/WD repeat-containing protein ebi [Aphelenchoides besseyi]
MDGGTFTSDEVNFLIYRYMLENGFQHTAFTFGCESNIVNSTIDGTQVPRGALITIIQKGLHFTEAEFFAALASTTTDTNDARLFESNLGTMGLLEAVLPDTDRMRILEEKVIAELGEEACSRKPPNLRIVEPPQPASDISASSSQSSSDVETLDGMEDENDETNNENPQPGTSAAATSSVINLQTKETPMAIVQPSQASNPATSGANLTTSFPSSHVMDNESNGMAPAVSMNYNQTNPTIANSNRFYTNGSNTTVGKIKAATTAAATAKPGMNGTNAREVSGSSLLLHSKNGKLLPNTPGIDPDIEMDREKVIILPPYTAKCHCMTTWCPTTDVDIVASGSIDGTAQICRLPLDDRTKSAHIAPVILDHRKQDAQSDVTGIDWNMNGKYLATSCYDGGVRVWNREGERVYEITNLHKGPIFALKWDPSGTRILSAGVDNSTIIWDPLTNETKKFMFHTQSALDVDWIDEEMFASCSVDWYIHICRVGVNKPIRSYKAHENEVNAVKFNRISKLLASCSDDRSLKIWSLEQDLPVFSVNAHTREIHAVRWAPSAPNIVATASFDHSHKIYDVTAETCTYYFKEHKDAVYSVAFSPDGRYIASGSFDGSVIIHDLNSGKLALRYTGTIGIYDLDWNRRGDRLAAACDDGHVLVMDIRCLKHQ